MIADRRNGLEIIPNDINNYETEDWSELDESKWHPIPSLCSSKYFGKWTHSAKGYSLILSDGINVWGEQRDVSYIEKKSQEWTACLEAGVKDLSQLVLSQLEERSSELRILPDDAHNKLTIELTALLDQLPYNWLFYLSELPSHVIEHHWTSPIAATLEFMSERIFRLEEEVKKKNKQLEELLPPNSIERKDHQALLNSCIETAVQNVVKKGTPNLVCSHLSHSPVITKLVKKRKDEQANKPDHLKNSSLPHNRPRAKSKKPLKGAFGEETAIVRQDSDEAERRAQIQALTRAEVVPTKKKKRLNI